MSVRNGIGRSTAALAAGLLAGAMLIAPAAAHISDSVGHLWNQHIKPLADERYVRSAKTYSGSFSCAGTTWEPFSSDTTFSGAGALRYRTTSAGDQVFRCNAALPDGATVTAVRFSVQDSSATEAVFSCHLWRAQLSAPIGTSTAMAAVVPATGGPEAPGAVRLSDTSITQPIVDNHDYSYWLQCSLNGTGSDIGVFGATVDYTTTGAVGAAN